MKTELTNPVEFFRLIKTNYLIGSGRLSSGYRETWIEGEYDTRLEAEVAKREALYSYKTRCRYNILNDNEYAEPTYKIYRRLR